MTSRIVVLPHLELVRMREAVCSFRSDAMASSVDWSSITFGSNKGRRGKKIKQQWRRPREGGSACKAKGGG